MIFQCSDVAASVVTVTAGCAVCGSMFSYDKPRGERGRMRKTCSKECRYQRTSRRLSESPCQTCGKMFKPRYTGAAKHCSTECFNASRCLQEVNCKHCGGLFRQTRGKKKLCSVACRYAFMSAKYKIYPSRTAMHVAAAHRRRVRMYCAPVEKFASDEIYARDGWKCGLCGGRVSKSLKWPHPKSASLDHIIPVSDGGAHTRANVQLAHLDCNARKQNGAGGQLRLFG